jgi:hypothetical protein
MTHSQLGAGRRAHLKIVAVALAGAAAVVMVGINARVPDAATPRRSVFDQGPGFQCR